MPFHVQLQFLMIMAKYTATAVTFMILI